MFEVAGSSFDKGLFELVLEKAPPRILAFIFKLGPVGARASGLLLLGFSFLFSSSRAPINFLMERGNTLEEAARIQQSLGYVFFAIAVCFYTLVFFFRQERMYLAFDKNSKIFSVTREALFRFKAIQSGHVPFQDVEKIEKTPVPGSPGEVTIISKKMPDQFKRIRFKVLSDEQFEYFPLNMERVLGK